MKFSQMSREVRNKRGYGVAVLILTVFLSSCAGLRHLPEGESLYIGNRLKIRKADSLGKFKIKQSMKKLSSAYLTVWDVPNGGVMGTPFFRLPSTRLWLYNVFRTEKEKGFKYWMRNNFGEEPVLVSDIQPELKCRKLEEVYENHGHFGTYAYYKTKTKRKGKKTKIKYYVVITPSYHYRKVIPDDSTNEISKEMSAYLDEEAVLEDGDEFSIEKLKKQRADIWSYLQDQGYYYLTPEQIIIDADSTVGGRQMDLFIYMDPSMSSFEKNKVAVDSVEVFIDTTLLAMIPKEYHYNDKGRYSYDYLDRLVRIDTDTAFSRKNSLFTSRLITQSGIFSRHSIYYTIHPEDSSRLNAIVDLRSKDATHLKIDLDANYKTIGYIGPSLKIQLNQYNMGGKGRNFSTTVNGYYDYPIGVESARVSPSYGVSWSSVLRYQADDQFINLDAKESYLPEFQWSQIIEYKNRLDLFEQISIGGSYGIDWSQNKYAHHRLNFVNLTLFDLLSTTAKYDSIASENNRISTSLDNQLIVSSSYSFTYDRRINPKWPRGYYFNVKLENAGNLINLANRLDGGDPSVEFDLFGATVVQFTNIEYEFKAFIPLGSRNTLAFRTSSGLGFAYGNSFVMPYSHQYYIGGSTSMRPFAARTFGPGTYLEFDQGEVNQVGDIKIESNFEYRFKLSPFLSSAIWADYGNIWLLNEDPLRPGSGIDWRKFLEESYLTSGIGLRVDLNFIMLRADLGIPLYYPIFPKGFRWAWENKVIYIAPSIGFGFPF